MAPRSRSDWSPFLYKQSFVRLRALRAFVVVGLSTELRGTGDRRESALCELQLDREAGLH